MAAAAAPETALDRFLNRIGKHLSDEEKKDKITAALCDGFDECGEFRQKSIEVLAWDMVDKSTISRRDGPREMGIVSGAVVAGALAKLDPTLAVVCVAISEAQAKYVRGKRDMKFVVAADETDFSEIKCDVIIVEGRTLEMASLGLLDKIEQMIHRNRAWCIRLPSKSLPSLQHYGLWFGRDLNIALEHRNNLWLLRELRRNIEAFTPEIACDTIVKLVLEIDSMLPIGRREVPLAIIAMLLPRITTAKLLEPGSHRDLLAEGGVDLALAIEAGAAIPPPVPPCNLLRGILGIAGWQFEFPRVQGIPTIVESLGHHYLPDTNGLVFDAPCCYCNNPTPFIPENVLYTLNDTLGAKAKEYIRMQRTIAEETLSKVFAPSPLRGIVYLFLSYL